MIQETPKLRDIKIKKFLSFSPNASPNQKYELIDASNFKEQFFADIERIEQSDDFMLCSRGNSQRNSKLHTEFINSKLGSLFMLGGKANFYRTKSSAFTFYESKPEVELIEELKSIIKAVNGELEFKERGKINEDNLKSFIESLNQESKEKIEHWKLFFLSLLHNIGKGKNKDKNNEFSGFKKSSPFISLSCGNKKYQKSITWATNKNNKGYVYVVCVNKNNPRFIRADKLKQELKKFNVNWYKDIHSEVILLNGFFPHHILGIMEVTKTSTPSLIINPWLHDEYLNNKSYDLINGIPINQEHFDEWINMEDFSSVFIQDFNNNQFVSTTKKTTFEKTNKFLKP